MAVKIQRLEGRDIPCEAQRKDATAVFHITDDNGLDEYRYNDVDAARRVVELSDRERMERSGSR
ncbi:hypothetical protein [Pseudomonas japonica]|uniref:hypothetical protein n=1 Tax=Pseudomonas japonica TaxID=256466 RepID=UPI0015E4836C|nr:hypothetical protein [Pseudomonas japonica]MBA1245252.1 hypothetical protein [Pseudomonas japonica]